MHQLKRYLMAIGGTEDKSRSERLEKMKQADFFGEEIHRNQKGCGSGKTKNVSKSFYSKNDLKGF